MIETTQSFNGPKHQTFIVTHKGFRRIVQFAHPDGRVIKDEKKFFKNHSPDCVCGEGIGSVD